MEITWLGHGTFQFVLPFFLLLFRGIKKSPKMLTAITVLQLAIQVVAMFWYNASRVARSEAILPFASANGREVRKERGALARNDWAEALDLEEP